MTLSETDFKSLGAKLKSAFSFTERKEGIGESKALLHYYRNNQIYLYYNLQMCPAKAENDVLIDTAEVLHKSAI